MKKHLLRGTALCGLVVALLGTAHADSVALSPGSDALLFQASSDIRLSAFNGGTISWKHQTSAAGAWRLGLTISAGTLSEDSRFTDDYDTLQTSWLRENDQDNLSLSIAADRLHYLTSESRISPYYGLGPMISASTTSYSSNDPRNRIEDKSETSAIDFGAGVVLGVECFPHAQIGIVGEYNSGLVYRWSKSESTRRYGGSLPLRTEKRERNQFEFRSGSVRLGVSIYW